MAVAKILSHTGKGLYAIELIFNIQRILKKRDDLTKEIDDFDSELLDLHSDLSTAQQSKASIEGQLNNILILTPQDTKAIQEKTAEINKLRIRIAYVEELISINDLKYSTVSLEKKRVDDHATRTELIEAWCIDYTLDLKMGDYVETLEAFDEYNEPNKYINIRPISGETLEKLEEKVRATGRITFPDEKKLRVLPQVESVLNSEKWTIAWNWMTKPAMQRWRPYYRVANISTIDHLLQTCRISYNNQPYRSSIASFPTGFDFVGGADRYDVNLNTVHDNVPFEYMHCGSSVFKVGDEVIIEYDQNQYGVRQFDKPKVIGFRQEPKRCKAQYLVYIDSAQLKVIADEIGNTGVLSGSAIDLLQLESEIALSNATNGRRLNYGQSITPEEISCVYSFTSQAVYKNGVEITQINSYLVDYPVGLGQNSVVGVEVFDGKLYVLAWTQTIVHDPQYQRMLTIENEDSTTFTILISGYSTGDDAYKGFRILVFDAVDFNFIESADIGITLNILYHNEEPIFKFNDWKYTFLPFGWEERNTQWGIDQSKAAGSLSKMFGFSVSNDYIMFSFATRHANALIVPSNTANQVMLVDRSTLKLFSHVWKMVGSSSPDINGTAIMRETETDIFYPAQGKVKISGSAIAVETNPDTFFATGQVT